MQEKQEETGRNRKKQEEQEEQEEQGKEKEWRTPPPLYIIYIGIDKKGVSTKEEYAVEATTGKQVTPQQSGWRGQILSSQFSIFN